MKLNTDLVQVEMKAGECRGERKGHLQHRCKHRPPELTSLLRRDRQGLGYRSPFNKQWYSDSKI